MAVAVCLPRVRGPRWPSGSTGAHRSTKCFRGSAASRSNAGSAWRGWRAPKSKEWRRRRGRMQDGFLDEASAHVAAAALVAQHAADAADRERVERNHLRAGSRSARSHTRTCGG
jgi:hypothetical protein